MLKSPLLQRSVQFAFGTTLVATETKSTEDKEVKST